MGVKEKLVDNVGPVSNILAGVGAANWLSVAVLNFDAVQTVSMGIEPVSALIYSLAGIAGIGAIWNGVHNIEY